MTRPLPPLTAQEYEVLSSFVREVDAREAEYREASGRRGFEDADAEALRDLDEFVAVMRAAVEGYEAANPDEASEEA
jgi:hypothetical protein